MPNSLKSKTLHALFWSFFERTAQQSIQFAISVVLARLLLPEQYGLIAMLLIFLAVSQSFLDSGFGSALIQKQDATHLDICSIFYFNIIVGSVATALLCFCAPWIASFYNEPQLTSLARFMSLNILVNSFGLIQTTLLDKQINFKTQAKVSLVTLCLSGPIGIFLAYSGFGVWSLAIQQVCNGLFRTILLWFYCAWRPSLIFSIVSLRTMFAFGSRLLASGLLDRIFTNIYSVVIGRLFSAVTLGFYTRAQSLQQLPADLLSDIIGRVTFPMFSVMQSDVVRLKQWLKKSLSMLAFISFPIFIGLAVVAKSLILTLLTEKWLPCAPYLQLLSLVGLMYPLHAINLNLLKALGRSDLFFRLEVLKKIFVVIVIAVTWQWGIKVMIYGQMALSVGAYYLNSYYTAMLIDYSLKEQLLDILPAFGLALIMGFCVYIVQFIMLPSILIMLSTQIVTGIIVYFLLGLLFRVTSCLEIVTVATDKLNQIKEEPVY